VSAPALLCTSTEGSTTTAAGLFLQLLYGRGSGYAELAWIDGDPDDRAHYIFDRTWFDYSPERIGELLDQVAELAQQYGNVYVSAHLYDAPRRDALVLPGHAIFVDDLPQGVPCSFSVHTSPTRRHGYFLLSQPANHEELRELSKRAAYAFAADKSGWDLQQLVRVPGTYNTKVRHGGHHLVTIRMDTERHYSPAELREAWPEAGPPDGEDGLLDWPEVEHWLGNLGVLIGDGGLPRRVKPTTQTGKVLLAELDDTSLSRYIVAKGLMLHGYPDDEIAALLWHYCEYDKLAKKGTAWLKADIQRIIGKVRAERPDIRASPTRARGEARPQPIPEQKPARRGRKTTLTPAALLQWYEGQRSCSDVIMLTVAEVAERLGVSRATVERCERTLRAEGHIERRTFNRRQTSLVALLRPLTIPEASAAAPVASAQVADPRPLTIVVAGDAPTDEQVKPDESRPVTTAPKTPPATRDHVPSAERHPAQQDAKNVECGKHGGTHPGAGTPPAVDQRPEPLASSRMPLPSTPAPSQCPSSPGLVRQAPATTPAPSHLPSTGTSPHLPTSPSPVSSGKPTPQRLPSWRVAIAEAFGYLDGRKRITRQMVVMFLESKYPDLVVPDQALDRLIAGERRQRAWAQQVEQLRSLKLAKLKTLSRMIDRVLAEGPDGPQRAQLPWASALYHHVTAELERRAELRDALDPERRRREREEYMTLAEREFRRQKAEGRRPPASASPPQAGALGGVCSPQHAPTQHELFSCGTETQASGIAGLVARLERLKRERGTVRVAMGGHNA
jgi:hypothetical protein